MAPTDRSDDTDQTTTPKENTETASRQSQTTDHQISFDEEQAPTPTDADAKQLTTAPDASAEETNGWDETSAPGRGTEAEITQEQISAAIDHPDGHLDSEHIGKTDTELADRLAAKPWLSGSTSFPDRATAEAFALKQSHRIETTLMRGGKLTAHPACHWNTPATPQLAAVSPETILCHTT